MIGIIILAAGKSSRMGKEKQNLLFGSITLLESAVIVAQKSGYAPIVVVIPPKNASLLESLSHYDVTIVENYRRNEGMSTSIQSGLAVIKTLSPNLQGCIFMVCDQPYVECEHLKKLADGYLNEKKEIVASEYSNKVLGVPAFFSENFFDKLNSLEGDQGAKKIIKEHSEIVKAVPLPKGEIDIDTEEDYDLLQR